MRVRVRVRVRVRARVRVIWSQLVRQLVRQVHAHESDERAEQRGAPCLPREGHLAWRDGHQVTCRVWARGSCSCTWTWKST